MKKQYISISCLPLPTFVQGGYSRYVPGDEHPNRTGFPYFVMILLIKGALFISENGKRYTVLPNQMIILHPFYHHFSWKPIDRNTEYYWIHFAVNGRYTQSDRPVLTNPIIDLPTLDYHATNTLLYLAKKQKIPEKKVLFSIIDEIFVNCENKNVDSFWRVQQLFIDLLQIIQTNVDDDDFQHQLANKTRLYLQDNFNKPITVSDLAHLFHVHPNTVIACMKEHFGITPNKFLMRYRLEKASKLLLSSKTSIGTIATEVGYENLYYFSRIFKEYYGISPSLYRSKYIENKSSNA